MNDVKKQQPFGGTAEALVARYEELRSQAIWGSCVGGHGFVLFVRRGMTAWMRAWSECGEGCGAHPGEMQGGGILLPAELRSEAATILAGMALIVAVG